MWEHWNEMEWSGASERGIGCMVGLYEREAVKATDQLYELISSSDVLLDRSIN